MQTPINNIDLGSFNTADTNVLVTIDNLYEYVLKNDLTFYNTAHSNIGDTEGFAKIAIPRLAQTAVAHDMKLPSLYLYRQLALHIAKELVENHVDPLGADFRTKSIMETINSTALGAPVDPQEISRLSMIAPLGAAFTPEDKLFGGATPPVPAPVFQQVAKDHDIFQKAATFADNMQKAKPADRSKPVLSVAVIRGFAELADIIDPQYLRGKRDAQTALKYLKRIVEWKMEK